jgi:hypothetical protein
MPTRHDDATVLRWSAIIGVIHTSPRYTTTDMAVCRWHGGHGEWIYGTLTETGGNGGAAHVELQHGDELLLRWPIAATPYHPFARKGYTQGATMCSHESPRSPPRLRASKQAMIDDGGNTSTLPPLPLRVICFIFTYFTNFYWLLSYNIQQLIGMLVYDIMKREILHWETLFHITFDDMVTLERVLRNFYWRYEINVLVTLSIPHKPWR